MVAKENTRIIITVSKELLECIDIVAKECNISRSKFINYSIIAFIKSLEAIKNDALQTTDEIVQ